jgi:hypothetical protein
MTVYRDSLFLTAAEQAFLERRQRVRAYQVDAGRAYARGVARGMMAVLVVGAVVGVLLGWL